jgi:acyl-CoA thioester hydrolase
MSTICETTLRVRYAETDQMAVVYHSNYLIWFEVGRVDLLRQLGFSYREMELDGLNLPVVEVKCRYRHPARYDDELTLRTRLAQMRTSLLRFHYELLRKADGRLLAEGESVHVVVGRNGKRTPLTGKYLTAIHAAAEVAQPLAEAETQRSANQSANQSAAQSANQSKTQS